MKYFLLISYLIHFGDKAPVKDNRYPDVNYMQVRVGAWPINLQRVIFCTDTCYAIEFRDQSTMNAVANKSMCMETLAQLKFFKEGLISLKKGNNGDVAEYNNFSMKKVGTNKNNSWYILSYDNAVTNFQEPQLNRMIFLINDLLSRQN